MDRDATQATFDEDGVLFVPGVFDSATIELLEADFDRIVEQLRRSGEVTNARWDSAVRHAAGADTEILHTHQVQRYSSAWLGALLDDRFLQIATGLLGPDVVLHHTKLFLKPPGHGAPFPMHQDWRYFPCEQDSMLAAVIHLTPATEQMGCVRTIAGSHRVGRRPSTSGRTIWDDPNEFEAFNQEFPLERATVHQAEPGDVLFFSSFTAHGSGPNISDQPRKTVLVQLFSGTDQLDPISDHPVDGLVLAGRNHHASRSSVTERSAAAAALSHGTRSQSRD